MQGEKVPLDVGQAVEESTAAFKHDTRHWSAVLQEQCHPPHAIQASQVHEPQQGQPLQRASRFAAGSAEGGDCCKQHPIGRNETKQVCPEVAFEVVAGHGWRAVHKHFTLKECLHTVSGCSESNSYAQGSASDCQCHD